MMSGGGSTPCENPPCLLSRQWTSGEYAGPQRGTRHWQAVYHCYGCEGSRLHQGGRILLHTSGMSEPNKGMQATANSVRSCLAPAVCRA
jgi:hypothetical protein